MHKKLKRSFTREENCRHEEEEKWMMERRRKRRRTVESDALNTAMYINGLKIFNIHTRRSYNYLYGRRDLYSLLQRDALAYVRGKNQMLCHGTDALKAYKEFEEYMNFVEMSRKCLMDEIPDHESYARMDKGEKNIMNELVENLCMWYERERMCRQKKVELDDLLVYKEYFMKQLLVVRARATPCVQCDPKRNCEFVCGVFMNRCERCAAWTKVLARNLFTLFVIFVIGRELYQEWSTLPRS